jgi:glycosyltransferase involved in cell wall biosynthesis
MKVSVIVPAYNEEKTIARTMDALLDQTHKNLALVFGVKKPECFYSISYK